MIDYHRFCQIKDLHEHQGLTASQIAQALALDPPHGGLLARAKSTSAPANPRHAPANSIRSNRRLSGCWNAIPIRAAQVFQRLREQGFAAAIHWSKPMCARFDPDASPLFSHWPLLPASVPRSIGAPSARSPWGKRIDS